VAVHSEFKPSADVLINKANLLDKIQMIKDLSLRMNELEREHVYSMQKSDMMHAQKINEVHENYCQAIKELKKKNEVRIISCDGGIRARYRLITQNSYKETSLIKTLQFSSNFAIQQWTLP
jgi:hypothetical protein